jgi:hypothetical protein
MVPGAAPISVSERMHLGNLRGEHGTLHSTNWEQGFGSPPTLLPHAQCVCMVCLIHCLNPSIIQQESMLARHQGKTAQILDAQ